MKHLNDLVLVLAGLVDHVTYFPEMLAMPKLISIPHEIGIVRIHPRRKLTLRHCRATHLEKSENLPQYAKH
jgi:hypothetical protein